MSGQRARSAVAADHRSVHPNLPGLPWWAAVLLAVTATAIGFAFDAGSGHKELSFLFAACYALGCVLAVLAVRQAGLFTAVIQPPLILFVSVPGAYFLFNTGQLDGAKDLLINCGYPLIERFPLMFFTSAAVLLIGMARWYFGMSARQASPATSSAAGVAARAGLVAAVSAKVSALVMRPRGGQAADDTAEPRRKHSVDRQGRPTRPVAKGEPARAGRRPVKRAAPSRSRHARPPETELIDPVTERPRRPRPPRHAEPPAAEPRRRSAGRREPRTPPPVDRRSGYERPERRRRDDGYENRYEDYLPPEPRRARPAGGSTHHPISRVRYRPSDAGGDGEEDRAQHRSRPRRSLDAEAWEFDV